MAAVSNEHESFWPGKPTLVTGAAGFIGSHLTEALVRAGARVRAFVRYNSRNDYGWLEVCDPALVDEVRGRGIALDLVGAAAAVAVVVTVLATTRNQSRGVS